MGVDADLLERVRLRLAGAPDVIERRMVGGRSFMVGGHLCCGVSGGALMVRVGPDRYECALSQPFVRPLILGRKAPLGYVVVDRGGYETDDDLATWVARGIEFVSSLSG